MTVEIALVVFFSLVVIVGFVWLDQRSTRRAEQYRRAMERHPSRVQGRCACGAVVRDMDVHRRLAHAPRVQGPDDLI